MKYLIAALLVMFLFDYYLELYAEPYDDGDGYMRRVETLIDQAFDKALRTR